MFLVWPIFTLNPPNPCSFQTQSPASQNNWTTAGEVRACAKQSVSAKDLNRGKHFRVRWREEMRKRKRKTHLHHKLVCHGGVAGQDVPFG